MKEKKKNTKKRLRKGKYIKEIYFFVVNISYAGI